MDSFNWQRFQSFEYKHKLFEIRNREGIFIWDVIRYDIFNVIKNKNVKFAAVAEERNSILRKIDAFGRLLRLLVMFFSGKHQFLMLTSSRNRTAAGKFYDQNINDVLSRYHNDSLILEVIEPARYKLFYSNSVSVYKNPICALLSRSYRSEDYSALIDVIQQEFGVLPKLNNEIINNAIKIYKADLFFYNALFRRKKFKAIFLTQSGIQKGLFKAAKIHNIPVTEFQHGLIENAHVAYSYNPKIDYPSDAIILPDFFCTFSDYWTRSLFLPVKEIIPIGNTAFYQSVLHEPNGMVANGLLVASANIYGEKLKDLILDFVKENTALPVFFKLHPNQWSEAAYFSSMFTSYKNVRVITNEYSIGDLLKKVEAILVIKSTAIFEALQAQRCGIVYATYDSLSKEELAGLPNVHFINNADELRAALKKCGSKEKYEEGYFFKAFDEVMFSDFMRKLKIN